MSVTSALAGEPLHGEGVLAQFRRLFTRTGQQTGNAATVKGAANLVTLLFQDILQEDRVSPLIRVWFSRLQMPVMHEALAEPDSFASPAHPARLLVAHMGSCAMGFHGGNFPAGVLEREIRRVVLFIEQYPEFGKRAYEEAQKEFQHFLSDYPAAMYPPGQVEDVAHQKEREKTLTIQYTIELRSLLEGGAVRDEIRDFLFTVWSRVMAVAAIQQGKQHAHTLELKKAATDLLWATRAQPSRIDRAGIIRHLPTLLRTLRTGMSLLEFSPSVQDGHIKNISTALTDNFMGNRLRLTKNASPVLENLTPPSHTVSQELCGLEVTEDDSEGVWGLWDNAHASQPVDDALATQQAHVPPFPELYNFERFVHAL